MQIVRLARIASLSAFVLGCGCTSGQNAVQPSRTSVNPATAGKLQFAVGTANIGGPNGTQTTGLNVVATLRQANGLSAFLVDTPTISLPFANTAPAAVTGIDAGKHVISGLPQVTAGPTDSTFGQIGGVFGTGFAPANVGTSGSPNYPKFALASANNALYIDSVNDGPGAGTVAATLGGTGAISGAYSYPIYGSAAGTAEVCIPFIGGPPAYTLPAANGVPGFLGFATPFTTFSNLAPTTGRYGLSVDVAGLATLTAAALLPSLAVLPAMPEPAFTPNADGSGTLRATFPGGAMTEALVYVAVVHLSSNDAPAFYTFKFTATSTITVPAALAIDNTGKPAPTFSSGDVVYVYAAGFDYPALELANSASQTPALTGPTGRSDVSTSFVAEYAVP